MTTIGVNTKHFVIDIKSGFAFGLMLGPDGACKGAQPLNVNIETLDGRIVNRFGPTADKPIDPILSQPPKAVVPYGHTMYAVELKSDGTKGQLFTIVWPKKEEADKGILPVVARKDLPDSLMDAGIAARPKGAGKKGVDDAQLAEALKNIDAMIGLDGAKKEIRQNIAIARFNHAKEEAGLATKPISRHMVFTGNPGTGKTTFAREVAKVYHALGFIQKPDVIEVKRDDLVGTHIGQSEDKTAKVLEKAKGGILFIDEAYALAPQGGGGDGKDFGGRVIDVLVAAMENMREEMVVIVAGYTAPMKQFIDSNPGLKSRFLTYIEFADYDMKQLEQIMDFMLKERGYTIADDARQQALGLLQEERSRAKKDFGNGRTVRNLVEMAEKELAMRLESEGVFEPGKAEDADALKAKLTTVTLEDVKNITLQGLSDNRPRMGFGIAAAPQPKVNDNFKPSPGVIDLPATVKKPLARFGQ